MRDPTLQDMRRRLLDDFPALREIRRRRPLDVVQLVKPVRDCAEYNRRYAAPAALELDRRMEWDHDYFPWDLVKAGLQYRFLSMVVPGMVEGIGGLTVMSALAMEELCSTCAGIANIFGAHALGVSPLMITGALAQWETVLREVALKEKEGEPVLMPLKGDIESVADSIWGALNEDNRVSLAVKFIDLKTGTSKIRIVNKYEKV